MPPAPACMSPAPCMYVSYASYALYISYISFLTVETNNTVCNTLGAYKAKYPPSIFSAV